MRILILLIFINLAFAKDLVLNKAEVSFLEFDKANLIKITNDGKEVRYFPHPTKPNKVVYAFAFNYKNPALQHTIKAIYKNKQSLSFKVFSTSKNYKSEKIQVNASKVKPSSKALERIQNEYTKALNIYKHYTNKALFDSSFILPLQSAITSEFGVARIFNNALASFHSGTDFRAKENTKIKAANKGIVKLAQNRYFAGNSIIIDHGYGIYSQYYHLAKIEVKVGQIVQKGQVIALSGSTGRVSGPHLHFGIVVDNQQVNPLDFINKFNALFNEI